MNDELTPDERAALSARIVGGARRIKPAGEHRGARIAGSIAAVLVVVIAGGVASTSILSAPQIATTPTVTATPTVVPTPTSTPTSASTADSAPAVAFGGDCGQMLTEPEAGELLAGGGAALTSDTRLSTDSAASLAQLGGLSCTWVSEGDALTVVVAAPAAIAPGLIASTASTSCSTDDGCEMGSVEGDLWIGVKDSSYPHSAATGFTAEQVSAAAARFERVIALVAGKPHLAPVASIASVRSGTWALTDCVALQARLEEVTGTTLTTQSREGNALLPNGLVDRVLETSAGVTRCAYRDADDDSRGRITVTLMPGASTPPSSVLDVPETFGTTVGGADSAWAQVPYDHTYMLGLAATVGQNRLTLDRIAAGPAVTDAERLAASTIAFVEGR